MSGCLPNNSGQLLVTLQPVPPQTNPDFSTFPPVPSTFSTTSSIGRPKTGQQDCTQHHALGDNHRITEWFGLEWIPKPTSSISSTGTDPGLHTPAGGATNPPEPHREMVLPGSSGCSQPKSYSPHGGFCMLLPTIHNSVPTAKRTRPCGH